MNTPAESPNLVAVVVDGDHVLLVTHHDRGRWELPAGTLQGGEDALTGLRRCVGHVTGLVVAVDRLSGVYTSEESRLTLVFLARHVVGQIHLGPGFAAAQWVPLGDITHSMLPPIGAEQVQHAVNGNTQPVIAHHCGNAGARGRLQVSR